MEADNEIRICVICHKKDDDKKIERLGEKGAKTLNSLAVKYNISDVRATNGNYVHYQCRKQFGHLPRSPKPNIASPVKRRSRSMSPGFDNIHDCFYCAKRFTTKEHKNGLISKACTLKVVDGVKNAIKMRNNDTGIW